LNRVSFVERFVDEDFSIQLHEKIHKQPIPMLHNELNHSLKNIYISSLFSERHTVTCPNLNDKKLSINAISGIIKRMYRESLINIYPDFSVHVLVGLSPHQYQQ
jgi:hypothetical protein